MPMDPTIVVVGHSRPAATARLLDSVARADVDADVTLVVSIDHGAGATARRSAEVAEVADAFEWPHGPKVRLDHDGVGLVGHFHRVGDLTDEHDAIVVLEDDLLVGKGFHRWARATLPMFDDDRIAGASLAAPWFDGFRHHRFEPIDDGTDAFFAQVPWYDGMVFTRQAWRAYRAGHDGAASARIPAAFDELDDDEWFPDLVRYLVASDRQWLLPRAAQATGTGAPGVHFEQPTDWFQSELATDAPHPARLGTLETSGAVYDAHMEPTGETLRRLVPDLPEPLVGDFLGNRELNHLDPSYWVVTTRPVRRPTRTWGARMHPLPMNLAFDEPGTDLTLGRVGDVEQGPAADAHAAAILGRHHARGRQPGRRQLLSELVQGSPLGRLTSLDRLTRTWRDR